jgi:hypothetical protein
VPTGSSAKLLIWSKLLPPVRSSAEYFLREPRALRQQQPRQPASHQHAEVRMDWLDEELARLHHVGGTPSEPAADAAAAVARWWRHLADVLERDVERALSAGLTADFSREGEYAYRVSNAAAGLQLDVALDAASQNVIFNYRSSAATASAPEGGILRLRHDRAAVHPYYSDQGLNDAQLSETLLKPVLFPALPSSEVAA